MATLRPNIAAFRAAKGLRTQEEFAELLGMHQGTLSKVLNGVDEPGRKFIANSLVALTDYTFADLFLLEGDIDRKAGA